MSHAQRSWVLRQLANIPFYSLQPVRRRRQASEGTNIKNVCLYPVRAPRWRVGGVPTKTKSACDSVWDSSGTPHSDPSLRQGVIYIYIYMGKNSWTLQKLIDELNSGEVDPLRHPDVELEVVRKLYGRHYRYYSNDNRRLYYLEKHQQRVQP